MVKKLAPRKRPNVPPDSARRKKIHRKMNTFQTLCFYKVTYIIIKLKKTEIELKL
jgi:hypothetical protein